MHYQEIVPHESLKHVVRYFWVIRSDSEYDACCQYKLFAESSASIIFFHAFQKAFLAGQSCQSRNTFISGKFLMIGACLFPYSVPLLFKISTQELTDNAIDLEDLCGSEVAMLKERILTCEDTHQKIEILSAYLCRKLKKTAVVKRSVHGCIEEIVKSGGHGALSHSVHQLGMSNRQVQRKFQEYVGFSPKVFHRIVKFHSALKFAGKAGIKSLTDIAYQSGYYDQSHFIREFKTFSGINPRQYFLLNPQSRADNFIRIREK